MVAIGGIEDDWIEGDGDGCDCFETGRTGGCCGGRVGLDPAEEPGLDPDEPGFDPADDGPDCDPPDAPGCDPPGCGWFTGRGWARRSVGFWV